MSTADSFKVEIGCYKFLRLAAEQFPANFDQFGKTALQKSFYLMQELYGLGTGYDYEFYNYGTFSQDLAADLSTAEALGIVEIKGHSPAGVDIRAGGADLDEWSSVEFPLPEGSSEAISQFKTHYLQTNRREMELDSTVVYVDRDLVRKGTPVNLNRFIDIVISVKSHFSRDEVNDSVQKIRDRGFVLNGLLPPEA